MTKKKKYIWFIAVTCLLAGSAIFGVFLAERHEREEKDHHRVYARTGSDGHEKDHNHENRHPLRPVSVRNENYKNNCGGCHLAYPPDLLPAASWNKILNRLEDHFGEALSLDDLTREEIRKYLTKNSADRSGTETAGKILRNPGGSTPTRITEVAYIRKKHREIASEVFKRKSVGSFSNCLACHKGAEQGDFDDDQAAIPR
jgi:nitrate/TMAO reductase-like tetraheme cytochrome c subunit